MSKYQIPNDIITELKLYKAIYLFDFFIVMGMAVIIFQLRTWVHPSFQLIYFVFMIILTLTLLIRPRSNPKMRMYQAVFLAVLRNRGTFRSINEPEQKGEKPHV